MINLPTSKEALRDALDLMVLDFFERGGAITYCRACVAQGASFPRNKSPMNNLGAAAPAIYAD